MSAPSVTVNHPRTLSARRTPAEWGTRGRVWTQSMDASPLERASGPPVHGCRVVRNITDDHGRDWRVRQLWSENCHGLLFQCAVPGVRSEVRPIRAPLETLTDDELVTALLPADD